MRTSTRLAILRMENAIAHMRFVSSEAERDNALGGWLCDHGAALNHWQAIYDEAKAEVEADPPAGEMPCTHEWYQGICIHCEITVAEFRKLPTHSGHT